MGRKKRCFDLISDDFWLSKIFNDSVSRLDQITCFLFDNGSFRPDTTLSLRALARRLSAEVGMTVVPVSLLHSANVAAEKLGGQGAELLEPALMKFAETGGSRAVLLPLFFGPSGALTDYLPERLNSIQSRYPSFQIKVAACLVNLDDDSAAIIASALAARVQTTVSQITSQSPEQIWVIATDHGSPKPAVTAVRNQIGLELEKLVCGAGVKVLVASMEKREGAEYSFNDPLLAVAINQAIDAGAQDIIVAQQFLQAGRHAGEGGDIAEICEQAIRRAPHVSIYRTPVLVDRPEIQRLLHRRLSEAITASSWTQPSQSPLHSG